MSNAMGHNFRADIEGFRAVCLLAVILYHAFPNLLPGGFVGVDAFFVVSGYLITSLLLKERKNAQGISLLGFWQRRVRRILPAASFVLISTVTIAPTMNGFDAVGFSRDVFAATFFYYNIRQASHSIDYLGEPQENNPFIHYWSLSVEEQFYLVWPPLLLITLSLIRRYQAQTVLLASVIIALIVVSLTSSVLLTQTNPPWGFFGTHSRAWQLLTGALIAATAGATRQSGWQLTNLLGVLGLGLLLMSFVFISSDHSYPGLLAIPPTVGTALVIFASGSRSTVVGNALSTPPLRFIGRISFSWYLWHWPVLVIGHHAFGVSTSKTLALIAISFVLSPCTYWFIEQPFRKTSRLAKPLTAYTVGLFLIASTAGSGVYLRFWSPDDVLIADNTYASIKKLRLDRPRIYQDHCLAGFRELKSAECKYGDKSGKRTVVLFGDSHAGNWFEPLEKAAAANGWRLLVRVKASCQPHLAPQTTKYFGPKRIYSECKSWQHSILAELDKLRPDLVVVGGTRHSYPVAAELEMLEALTARSKQVLLMRDTPWMPENVVDCLRTKGPRKCKWQLDELITPRQYPRVSKKQLPAKTLIVDFNEKICPSGVCRAVYGSDVIMFDSHHLSRQFSLKLASEFQVLLKKYE